MPAFLALTDPRSGERREFSASTVRIGRDPSFECCITGEGSAVVSGTHAVLEHDGTVWAITDLASRNGTYLDDRRLAANVRTPVDVGAVLAFGERGPQLRVDAVRKSAVAATMVEMPASTPARPQAPARPDAPARPKPAAAGPKKPGPRTLAFEAQIAGERDKARTGVRNAVIAAVVLVALAGAAAMRYAQAEADKAARQVAEREAEVARQVKANDSLRLQMEADAEQLRSTLAAAEAGGGSSVLVDSLRRALNAANVRSAELETSLQRVEKAVALQQTAADSSRRAAQAESERLRATLANAARGTLAPRTRDSLQRRLDTVQTRVTEAAQVDATVKSSGANVAQLAQINAGAIGLVSGWFGGTPRTVSGVVVSASGLMLVGRAALRDGDTEPDSITVSVGGARTSRAASEIVVPRASDLDLAVIQVDEYSGPHAGRVDWKGGALVAGDATAILGMPTGVTAGTTVRPVVAVGVIGAIGTNQVAYDATTTPGAAGSALFNSRGELVAIHAGRGKKGYVAVPLKAVRRVLPDEVRTELGL